mmetsp:Transcript_56891/g.144266  ORF Transcript_56891/g.144266 Transcript_56891/m.144266 type:complete len:101 (+) Transcript_56891:113-415(+)|eukprot:CAMPEP_0115451674 /NCGR_PEP_ID=MMETSP0271-20121206/42191_1 /TAXON_ID=71861 /ORGANISM="Scrippsiella trochoidea, Strain CCMP3099" /LENGTH=100 /DNA_ID=CAMNT_0002877959 /DNA_START=107 /DNA_END=409 /DNA_ORIENTATION=-
MNCPAPHMANSFDTSRHDVELSLPSGAFSFANCARVLVALLGLILAGVFVWLTEAWACKPQDTLGLSLGGDFREAGAEALQVFVIFSLAATAGKIGKLCF